MVDINNSEAFAFGRDYSGSGNWLDRANGHDGVITGATWVDAGAASYFGFDGNDQIAIPNAAGLNFALADSFTLGVCYEMTDISAKQTLMSKKDVDDNTDGYWVGSLTASVANVKISDGANSTQDPSTGTPVNNTVHTVVYVRDRAADDVNTKLDGETGTGKTDTLTGSSTTTRAVRLGANHITTNYFLTGRIYSYCIIRSALSDAEAVILDLQLRNQTTAASGIDESRLGSPEGWGFVRMGFALFAARPRLVRPEGLLLPERLIIPGTA